MERFARWHGFIWVRAAERRARKSLKSGQIGHDMGHILSGIGSAQEAHRAIGILFGTVYQDDLPTRCAHRLNHVGDISGLIFDRQEHQANRIRAHDFVPHCKNITIRADFHTVIKSHQIFEVFGFDHVGCDDQASHRHSQAQLGLGTSDSGQSSDHWPDHALTYDIKGEYFETPLP